MQRLEVQVNFDNAENAVSVCIAMSYHRIDTHLELLERPPANLFCPASSASSRSTVRPTNYTSISQRYGSIKGRWVINPSLSIPSSVLPPLPEGTSEDARKNLFLETKDGKIEADVTLLPCSVPDSGDEKGRRGKRVVLYVKDERWEGCV